MIWRSNFSLGSTDDGLQRCVHFASGRHSYRGSVYARHSSRGERLVEIRLRPCRWLRSAVSGLHQTANKASLDRRTTKGKGMRAIPILFIALLVGCASLGLETPKSFDDKLAYSYAN